MAEATETALASIREEVERAFSSAPGAVLEAALSRIAPADECARAAAYSMASVTSLISAFSGSSSSPRIFSAMAQPPGSRVRRTSKP